MHDPFAFGRYSGLWHSDRRIETGESLLQNGLVEHLWALSCFGLHLFFGKLPILHRLNDHASLPKTVKPCGNYGGIAWATLFNPKRCCDFPKTSSSRRWHASRPVSAML